MRGIAPCSDSSSRSGSKPYWLAVATLAVVVVVVVVLVDGVPSGVSGLTIDADAPAMGTSGPAVMVAWLAPVVSVVARVLAPRVPLTPISATGRPPIGSLTNMMRATTPSSTMPARPNAMRASGSLSSDSCSFGACCFARLRPRGALRSSAIDFLCQRRESLIRGALLGYHNRPGSGLMDPASALRLGRIGVVLFLPVDQPDGELQLGVVLLVGRDVHRRSGRGRRRRTAADLAIEPGLAENFVAALEIVRDILGYHDVRLDAGRLNRAVVRRIVPRRGEADAAIVAHVDDRLHRALAERARADEG